MQGFTGIFGLATRPKDRLCSGPRQLRILLRPVVAQVHLVQCSRRPQDSKDLFPRGMAPRVKASGSQRARPLQSCRSREGSLESIRCWISNVHRRTENPALQTDSEVLALWLGTAEASLSPTDLLTHRVRFVEGTML